MTSRYDKEYLLAFGEFLPFGDQFPILYKWSPNSGRFTPGTSLDPLLLDVAGKEHPVTALICYEDILPRFTNAAVRKADPELIVNITNDAWFGDTAEPWEHLALSQLRAVEHHRYFVRGTNSGVSAVIDPVGRVIAHGGTFRQESFTAPIHWMRSRRSTKRSGTGPGRSSCCAAIAAAFVGRKGATLPATPAAAAASAALLSALLAGARRPAPPPARMRDATRARSTLAPTRSRTPRFRWWTRARARRSPPSTSAVRAARRARRSTAAPRRRAATASWTGGGPQCALLANCYSDCVGAVGDAGGPDAKPGCNAECVSEYGSAEAAYKTMQACVVKACTSDAGTAPCDP